MSPVHKPVRITPNSHTNGKPTTTTSAKIGGKTSPRKVCNEDMVAPPVISQEGTEFDFTAHMKSVRPNFNRFGQHEPATVSLSYTVVSIFSGYSQISYPGNKATCKLMTVPMLYIKAQELLRLIKKVVSPSFIYYITNLLSLLYIYQQIMILTIFYKYG